MQPGMILGILIGIAVAVGLYFLLQNNRGKALISKLPKPVARPADDCSLFEARAREQEKLYLEQLRAERAARAAELLDKYIPSSLPPAASGGS